MIRAALMEFSVSGREMRRQNLNLPNLMRDPAFFNLNTYLGFTNDTIIGGYKFTLKNLTPYPSIKNTILPKSYKAEIDIEKVAE